MHVPLSYIHWFAPNPHAVSAGGSSWRHSEPTAAKLIDEHVQSKRLACPVGPAQGYNTNIARHAPEGVDPFLAHFKMSQISGHFDQLYGLVRDCVWVYLP